MRPQPRLAVYAGIALLTLGGAARAASRIEKNLKLDPGGKFALESNGGDVIVTGRGSGRSPQAELPRVAKAVSDAF